MMKKIAKYWKILYGIMALVCTGAILYLLWWGGAFLPGWIAWENGVLYDKAGQYEVVLAHRKVQVRQEDTVIWTSPRGLKVQQAQVNDIDNDGQDELILLCWRIGKYGKSRPFWVEHNERKWSQHIAVYECNGEQVKTKWMASDIGFEVREIWAGSREAYVSMLGAEAPDDVAVRPSNRLIVTDQEGKLTCWFWDSWGFTREMTDVSFVAFGDNLIHEPIYQYGLYHDEDFSFLFANVKDVIAQSDISVINQETPLTDNPAQYGDYPRFGTPAQVGEAISEAGFDVVTCATNHALDLGLPGIDFTKRFFDDAGVMCVGIQETGEKKYQPYDIIVRNGIRIALVNYSYGTNGIQVPVQNRNAVHMLEDEKQIKADLAKAKADSDFVVAFAHWGTEYAKEADDFQKKWARIFLECGVDVTVGTHPHALQPYEMLRDESGHEMLLYYSIGNYISAQPEESCVKGGMAYFTVSLTADGYRITDYGLRPLEIVWQEKMCTTRFLSD